MIMLILRHAWLNLWDKHMTTGRINQVSKNQFSMQKHQKLNLHTNLHPMRSASCRTWAQRILLSSHLFNFSQSQHASYISLIDRSWRCNKRISTHCNSMRNSEFIKSTNTNSQTLCNSEELQDWEGCTLQLAPAAPKEETTRTLNWSTFSMRRLTLQKPPANFADFFFRRFT